MKLGIIGTNWITQQFVEAAESTGDYQLTAIYSRHEATAAAFAAKTHEATLYTELPAFFASDLDVVYIASPNGLHAEQAAAALNAGKHVIVEKPMVTHPSQLALIESAQAAHPECLIFEAARHLYDPNFAKITALVQQRRAALTGATLVYAKYSSRYDAYLAGENPNIFSPRFGGGALMDLGVYSVYAAVAWFGVPEQVVYLPSMLASGVDGGGVAHLHYADVDVNLVLGKNYNTSASSEIYFGKTTLQLGATGSLDELKLVGAETADLHVTQPANPMVDEARYFAHALMTHDQNAFEQQWQLAKQVHQVLGDLRATTTIKIGNDPQ